MRYRVRLWVNRSGLALMSYLDWGSGGEKGVVNLRSSLTLLLEQVSYDLALSDVPKMGALFKKY